ncbi:hypothetical protein GGF42_006782 [Coemansia sp. RSA 2424]|nr:hypothetical protein GGF42_006782 [Coemansia sp. RSA 2424]
MTATSDESDKKGGSVAVKGERWRDMQPIILREIEQRAWMNQPRIGIVHTVENWDLVERLVNELRYELKDRFHINVFNVKMTQAESIHEIPLYIARMHTHSEIIFAVGVELMSSPTYEPRLVDLLTRRIDAVGVGRRLPVFDCILVRESREQLEHQMQALSDRGSCIAESWARRGIDAYTALCRGV